MRTHWTPTSTEIGHAPELGTLAILDRTLRTAADALVAAHPDLVDVDWPYDDEPNRPDAIGRTILSLATALCDVLDIYRRRAAAELPPQTQIHFADLARRPS